MQTCFKIKFVKMRTLNSSCATTETTEEAVQWLSSSSISFVWPRTTCVSRPTAL